MSKSRAELALEAYLAGLTEKKAQCNDNFIMAIHERNADPEYHKKKLNALHSVMATQEWKEANNAAVKRRKQDPNWIKEQQARIVKRSTNEEWRENVGKASTVTHGVCCVTPLGIFPSVQQAGKYYDELRGTKCGVTVVCRNLKKGTTGYKYITREEYQKLTLNTPILDIADK